MRLLGKIGIIAKMPHGRKIMHQIPDKIGAYRDQTGGDDQQKMPPLDDWIWMVATRRPDQHETEKAVKGGIFGKHADPKRDSGINHRARWRNFSANRSSKRQQGQSHCQQKRRIG